MRRVLIVDDEPIIVNGLLSALEESALDVDLYSAYSGEEALNILARKGKVRWAGMSRSRGSVQTASGRAARSVSG